MRSISLATSSSPLRDAQVRTRVGLCVQVKDFAVVFALLVLDLRFECLDLVAEVSSVRVQRPEELFALLEFLVPVGLGSPLCRAASRSPEFDGIEIALKGGQVKTTHKEADFSASFELVASRRRPNRVNPPRGAGKKSVPMSHKRASRPARGPGASCRTKRI